jgi:hypothetical protein
MARRRNHRRPSQPLKKPNPQGRQQSLQDRRQANQHNKNFQEIVKPSVPNESVDQVKQDGADDDNNQNIDEYEEHFILSGCWQDR